jgi:hypothetical protein
MSGLLHLLPRRPHEWTDDDSVTECYLCKQIFNWYYRRHHCRGCGRIFCGECSKYEIFARPHSYLINSEDYLYDHLNQRTVPNKVGNGSVADPKVLKMVPHRACAECSTSFDKISQLATQIVELESRNLSIIDYHQLLQNEPHHKPTIEVIFSRFREIQYHLPNHKFTAFEIKMLDTNYDCFIGHNLLLTQALKSIPWNQLEPHQMTRYLNLLESTSVSTSTLKLQISCESLLCGHGCQPNLTISEIIDILLHIEVPCIRQYAISFMTENPEDYINYISVLTYSARLDSSNVSGESGESTITSQLLKYAQNSREFRLALYWELNVQLQEPLYNANYTRMIETLLVTVSPTDADELTKTMNLVDYLSRLRAPTTITQEPLTPKLYNSDDHCIFPTRADLHIKSINFNDIREMNSAKRPVWIPCQTYESPDPYILIYKADDIRKDSLVIGAIRIMDTILKSHGLDLNIITYKVVPTGLRTGLIEVVPDSETLLNVKEKLGRTLQNYILENNGNTSIDEVRQRYVRSTAGYCVMTYLLGIGDRHLDNIMMTKDGRLFHIDYSFLMGRDPKPMAPKMRIIDEMLDALGGRHSQYYLEFEDLCTQAYNILRPHANLFMNILSLISRMNLDSTLTMDELETEVRKRFLPGEYRTQAKIHLLNTIKTSQASTTFIDFIHSYASSYQQILRNPWFSSFSNTSYSGPSSASASAIPKSPVVAYSPISLGAKIAQPILNIFPRL